VETAVTMDSAVANGVVDVANGVVVVDCAISTGAIEVDSAVVLQQILAHCAEQVLAC
jgi:hypothetical protein